MALLIKCAYKNNFCISYFMRKHATGYEEPTASGVRDRDLVAIIVNVGVGALDGECLLFGTQVVDNSLLLSLNLVASLVPA